MLIIENLYNDKIIGKQFGLWNVLYKDKEKYNTRDIRYICQCKCGIEKSVFKKYLLNGKSISCGCSKKVDLTGKKFGRLIVIETIYNHNGYNRATYKCRCDCGNIIYVKSASIYKTNSCGCTRRTEDETGNKYGKLTILRMLYNYKNGETYCECSCDCGNIIITRLNALHTKNTSSCGCSHSPNIVNQKFGKLTVIKEIKNNSSQRTWLCKCDCGNEVYLTTHILTSGHTQSCGCLVQSHGELLISQILQKENIEFIEQYRFDDCKNIKPLPFDFYIPKLNICIEYDGIQHFEPINFFGGTDSFIERQKNDLIKNEYCENNNILLLRIPYYLSNDEIENTLINFIQNPVTITLV